LYTLQAVAVSPPPMTVVKPASVAATIFFIIVLVPASKLATSNTPIPDDGLVGSDGRSVQLDGLGTAVQSHGALGDTNVNSSGTHLTILTEFAGSDEPAAALLVAQGETYRSLPVLRWFTMSYNPRPIADCRLFPSGNEQSAVRGFFTVL
jgi:hypothetical protein